MAEPTTSPPRPMFTPAVPNSERPLSPHLQVWKWTITMASSIMQRATGIALYGGFALLTAWLASAAISAEAYGFMQGILGSVFGIVVLIGFTWAQMFHLSKGILHLMWDSGTAIGKRSGKTAALTVFIVSVLLTAAVWGAVLGMKG